MARLEGIELPKNKRVEIGMTYIYGIGRSSAQDILESADVDAGTRVKDVTEA
jgi:small subunit ribosomal protein S13